MVCALLAENKLKVYQIAKLPQGWRRKIVGEEFLGGDRIVPSRARTWQRCAGPGAGHEKVSPPVSSFSGAMYLRRLIICCCHDPARPLAGAATFAEEDEEGARVKFESTGFRSRSLRGTAS